MRWLGAVLVLVLLPACATADSPSPAGTRVETTSPTVSSEASPSPTPETTAMATPEPAGGVVFQVAQGQDVFLPWGYAVLTVFDDGRLLEPSDSGWGVRRLTAAGITALMADALASGFLDHDVSYTWAPGFVGGAGSGSIAGLVDGKWVTAAAHPTTPDVHGQQLLKLIQHYLGFRAWLSADAWVDPSAAPQRYLPPTYTLLVTATPDGLKLNPGVRPADVGTVRLPLESSLLEIGAAMSGDRRCAELTWSAAKALRDALYGLGYQRTSSDEITFSADLNWEARNGVVYLEVNAEPPDPKAAGCSKYG